MKCLRIAAEKKTKEKEGKKLENFDMPPAGREFVMSSCSESWQKKYKNDSEKSEKKLTCYLSCSEFNEKEIIWEK